MKYKLLILVFVAIIITSSFVCGEDLCEEISEDSRYNYDIAGTLRVIKNGVEVEPPPEDKCGQEINNPILFERWCDGTTLKEDEVKCKDYDKKCLRGRCVEEEEYKLYMSCEETSEDSRYNYNVAGALKVIRNGEIVQKPYEDSCGQADPVILYEWWCNDANHVVDEVICEEFGKRCDEGRCVPAVDKKEAGCREVNGDIRDNYDLRGHIEYSVEYDGESQVFYVEDSCIFSDEKFVLNELWCEGNSLQRDIVNCEEQGGKVCFKGTCADKEQAQTECAPKQVYDIHLDGCFIVDRDADGILDDDEGENCKDTAFGDLVDWSKGSNTYGCSCEQGALEVTEVGDLEQTTIDCTVLKEQEYCKKINTEYEKEHCSDTIQNCGELSTDCGVDAGCKPCDFPCVPLSEEGGLKIGIFPYGYSSTNKINEFYDKVNKVLHKVGLNLGNNYFKWVKRANRRFKDLVSYYPFEEDKISFYRIDFFPQIEIHGEIFSDFYLFSEYKYSCSGLDFIVIESVQKSSKLLGGGLVAGSVQYDMIYSEHIFLMDDYGIGNLAHELGHSLCQLNDDYSLVRYDYYMEDSFNCDLYPRICSTDNDGNIDPTTCRMLNFGETCDDPENNKKCLCKWDPNHFRNAEYLDYMASKGLNPVSFPDAGCTLGCGGGKNAKVMGRPIYEHNPSLMDKANFYANFIRDPPFNIVSEEVCRQYVEMYQ